MTRFRSVVSDLARRLLLIRKRTVSIPLGRCWKIPYAPSRPMDETNAKPIHWRLVSLKDVNPMHFINDAGLNKSIAETIKIASITLGVNSFAQPKSVLHATISLLVAIP